MDNDNYKPDAAMLPPWIPPGVSFAERLRTLSHPIARYHGVYFSVEVGHADISYAGMDYRKIYVNPLMARFSDELLFAVLAHEWAHRIVSPCSPQNASRIAEMVSKTLGLELRPAQLLAGFAYELLVDHYNSVHPTWGVIYKNAVRDFLSWAFDQEDSHHTDLAEKNGSKFLRLQYLSDATRWACVSDDRLPSSRVSMESKARNLVSILISGEGDEDTRILQFTKAVKPELPYPWPQQPPPLDLFQRALKSVGEQLEKYAQKQGNGDGKAAGTSVTKPKPDSPKGPMVDLHLTREVTRLLLRHSQRSHPVPGIWDLSNPRSRLDLKRSFRTSPVLIPGLTTRQQTPGARTSHRRGKDRLKLCLVVDDSGSMQGMEALFARSLCEGINRFAEIERAPIGLITFGGTTDCSIIPGFRNDEICASIGKLDGCLGGTRFGPALQALEKWTHEDPGISHIVLITDSNLDDWSTNKELFECLTSRQRWTILIINNMVPPEFDSYLASKRRNVIAYQIDPTQPPSEVLLKEIIR